MTLGFGYSSRQDAKTPSSEKKDYIPQTNSLPLIRPLRLGVFAGDLPAFGCGVAALRSYPSLLDRPTAKQPTQVAIDRRGHARHTRSPRNQNKPRPESGHQVSFASVPLPGVGV